MARRNRSPRPKAWYWNTYFIFGILLAVVGLVGVFRGAAVIGDPGQIRDIVNPLDPRLPWIYFGAAVLFLLNGLVSHKAYLAEFAGHVKQSSAEEVRGSTDA